MEKRRNYLIDVLRIIATVGVIGIHVANDTKGAESFGAFFSPICVPFFFMVSLTYFVSGISNISVTRVSGKIFRRIIVPLLSWTAIYLILLFVKRSLVNKPTNIVLWRAVFYGDTALHLYFLAHLIMMQLTALAIYLIFKKNRHNSIYAIGIFFFVTCYFIVGLKNDTLSNYWPIQVITYITAAFVILELNKAKVTSLFWGMMGLFLLSITYLAWFHNLPYNLNTVLQHLPLGGIGLTFVANSFKVAKLPRLVTQVAAATFGIYLCHVLFLEAFESVEPRIWKGGLHYDLPNKLLVVFSIFICSFLFTLLLQRYRFTRKLFLGEN